MTYILALDRSCRYAQLRTMFSHPRARAISGSLASAFTSQLIFLVAGIIVARSLGPENRGYQALLLFVIGIVGTVVGLGIATAATYYISLPTVDNRSVVSSSFQIYLIQIVLIVGFQFALLLSVFRNYPAEFRTAFLLTLPIASASGLYSYGLAFLQGSQDFRMFNVLRLSPLFFYMVLLLVIWLLGIVSLLTVTLVWVVGSIVGTLAIFAAVARYAPSTLTTSTGLTAISAGDLTRFGARSFLGASSPVETFRIDQAVVAALLTPAALGIYAAALSFTNLPRFIGQSVGVVAFPVLASAPSSVRARQEILRYAGLTVVLSIIVIIPLVLLAPYLVTLLLGSEFAAAAQIIRILLIGSLLFSLRRVLSDSLRGLGYPQDGTAAEVISWVALILTLPLLASRYELVGVAISMVIASAIGVVWPAFRVWTLPNRESDPIGDIP